MSKKQFQLIAVPVEAEDRHYHPFCFRYQGSGLRFPMVEQRPYEDQSYRQKFDDHYERRG
jgi:hypothetical protein